MDITVNVDPIVFLAFMAAAMVWAVAWYFRRTNSALHSRT